MDCSLSDSSVHGISQARILEWVAISFSNAWKWSRSVVSNLSLRRPQASFRSPEGEETLRPPRSDLRSPGKISKLGGFRAPDGDSTRVRERETWGDQSFEELIPILYFPWSTFIHWDVMQKSRGVSSPDFYQSQVLHTKVYRGLRGVTSSSGRGACWQFTTLSLWQRSVNQDTYFSRGDYS